MNQASKDEKTIKTCHAYLIVNIQKNIGYSLVIDPTVSTILISEHFKKAKILEN